MDKVKLVTVIDYFNKALDVLKKDKKDLKKMIKDVLRNPREIKHLFKIAPDLKSYYNDARMLITMLDDYRKGKYKKIHIKSIAAIVIALLYVLNPLDIIPDFIPVFGFADDATVMKLCFDMIYNEFQGYKNWKVIHG